MAFFLHTDKPVVLMTSFKVMYTLLCRQGALRKLCGTRLPVRAYWWHHRQFSTRRRMQVVRDPHARLRSFFRNKFRNLPARSPRPFSALERCQKIFAPYLDIAPGDSPPAIQRRLLECPFDRFVSLLPRVYHRDAHLWPQCWIQQLCLGPIPVGSFGIHRALKMEHPGDMGYLSGELGLDLSKKFNHDPNSDRDEDWSAADRAIVQRLYQRDFELFGYGVDDYRQR